MCNVSRSSNYRLSAIGASRDIGCAKHVIQSTVSAKLELSKLGIDEEHPDCSPGLTVPPATRWFLLGPDMGGLTDRTVRWVSVVDVATGGRARRSRRRGGWS